MSDENYFAPLPPKLAQDPDVAVAYHANQAVALKAIIARAENVVATMLAQSCFACLMAIIRRQRDAADAAAQKP